MAALSILLIAPLRPHAVTLAEAGEAHTCVTSDAAFNGPGPYLPGVTVGREGEHVRLYRVHPSECGSAEASACKSKAYLIPGDRVELAAACGGYAHVRYIGKSRTSIGWVELSALSEGPAAIVRRPHEELEPEDSDVGARGENEASDADILAETMRVTTPLRERVGYGARRASQLSRAAVHRRTPA